MAGTGLEIGRSLELARAEKGVSLKEVEQDTKIRAGYLRELERENFDVLPAIYAQGSLKTYADYLGLDGAAFVREVKRRQERERPLDEAPPVSGGDARRDEGIMTIFSRTAAVMATVGGSYRPYLGLALLALVFVVATFALTPSGDGRPSVSEVREPLASRVSPDGARSASQPEQGQRSATESTSGEEVAASSEDGPGETGQDKPDQKQAVDAEDDESSISSASVSVQASASASAAVDASATAAAPSVDPAPPAERATDPASVPPEGVPDPGNAAIPADSSVPAAPAPASNASAPASAPAGGADLGDVIERRVDERVAGLTGVAD